MRKHTWAIIAGVCVVVLLGIVGVVLFFPQLFDRGHSSPIPDDMEIVIPAHWWKTSLNEQQIETLRRLWHTQISTKQLIDALWPGVLSELPAEADASSDGGRVMWPAAEFDVWKDIQAWSMSVIHPAQGTAMMFDVYLGCPERETDDTFLVDKSEGITSEVRYRISMYTDEVLGPVDSPSW